MTRRRAAEPLARASAPTSLLLSSRDRLAGAVSQECAVATTLEHAPRSVREQLSPADAPGTASRPTLLLFFSPKSGQCRRVEGFLAQVLQRRQNHAAFTLRHIDADEFPELAQRLAVDELPTIIVVERKRVAARLKQPSGCVEIQTALEPWLR
jgi:thiol-disulfide isomerase/thioredoxin